MSVKSTFTRYGSVAIAIHWSSAAAVILAFAAGFSVANLAPPERQAPILVVHVTLGIIVLVLTLLRIVWWLVADKHPAPPADQPSWQRVTANVVHAALYVILLLMATSGITTLILSGAMPAILSGGPVPDFSELIPRMAHGIMSKILLALFALHVGAALYHQVIRRDHLLARMGVGRT
ncbi:MAG TPA: cytochrome b/b6 domain-containing protein [Devosia sp.]|nr:cytochrome b/b6 domain-containing protein [Devosia sp.]